MLESILEDVVEPVQCSNEPIFDSSTDFGELKKIYESAAREYGKSGGKKSGFSLDEFLRSKNIPNIKGKEYNPSRNYYLLSREANQRIKSGGDGFQRMPIDSLEFGRALEELVESLENISQIRDLYRFRKKTCGESRNSGISSDEAAKLRHCMIQGRELYLSGLASGLLVKPLNLFYSLTAYSYCIIVLNNPIRFNKGMLPGSHAMDYLPDNVRVQFGGDLPRGTFSDLVTSFPTQLISGESQTFVASCAESILKFYEKKHTVSIGTLLSLVPEMSEFYRLAAGRPSRAHPLEIEQINDPRSVKWRFKVGNGERRPDRTLIELSFPGFSIGEMYGRYTIDVPADGIESLRAMIYADSTGNLYYVENPFFPIQLPEICVHFLILFCYSNIMRYRPDEWGALINNEIESEIPLITRQYFSIVEKKFNLLVLRSMSKYFPISLK